MVKPAHGERPSPASGVSIEVLECSAPGGRIIWLLEPLRNAAVTHYTGIMEHPAGTGQLAHTLAAFVHFAFERSGGEIIFADIQGISSVYCSGSRLMKPYQVLVVDSVPRTWAFLSLT